MFFCWMPLLPTVHCFVVHNMDIGGSNKHGKGRSKARKGVGGSGVRLKPINWPPAFSEFLLDWYIEKKLELPPKGVIKKMHHTACTSAINAKYGSTYNVDQVQRHYRRHKETWALVACHLNESGGGWDETNKMLSLSQSTLDSLSVISCCFEYMIYLLNRFSIIDDFFLAD